MRCGVANAMTIDVEDYFQVEAFASTINRGDWESLPCRIECNTERLLQILAEGEVEATFFVLGWVAERHPAPARRIVAHGHELASHGFDDIRVDRQSPRVFAPIYTTANRFSRRQPSAVIVPRPSRLGAAVNGRTPSWLMRASSTAPASIRYDMISTAPPARLTLRLLRLKDCSKSL